MGDLVDQLLKYPLHLQTFRCNIPTHLVGSDTIALVLFAHRESLLDLALEKVDEELFTHIQSCKLLLKCCLFCKYAWNLLR